MKRCPRQHTALSRNFCWAGVRGRLRFPLVPRSMVTGFGSVAGDSAEVVMCATHCRAKMRVGPVDKRRRWFTFRGAAMVRGKYLVRGEYLVRGVVKV